MNRIADTLRAARREGLDEAALERRVWERHGTTCAMLAVDSSGMTRITRARGIVHFLSRYLDMTELATPLLEQHRCLASRHFADNLFAEFATTDAALACALALHQALAAAQLPMGAGEHYRVCIGIGHGRVLRDGDRGVMGDEMNLTAKLAEDVAAAGETLLTQNAWTSLTQRVPAQRRDRRLGELDVAYYCLTA